MFCTLFKIYIACLAHDFAKRMQFMDNRSDDFMGSDSGFESAVAADREFIGAADSSAGAADASAGAKSMMPTES